MSERDDRLLSWIAGERAVRAVILCVVGLVLVSHPHTDWARSIADGARDLGLNPRSDWVQRLLHDVAKVSSKQGMLFGVLAIAYGALEGVESYGLWRRRRWGEWLTVLATSLLLIPEAWELTRSLSALKLATLLLNVAVVAYLLWRLRGRSGGGGD